MSHLAPSAPVAKVARSARLAAVLALALVTAGLAGCGRRADPEHPGTTAAKPAGTDGFGAGLPVTKPSTRNAEKPKTPFLLDPLL